jgi:MFS family permease
VLSPDAFEAWGWRIPFLLSALVVLAGFIIRRPVDETPVFQEEAVHGEIPKAPIKEVIRESWPDMIRVMIMALTNVIATVVVTFGGVYATNPAYGNGFSPTIYLWIPFVGNAVAVLVIPFVGSLSDRIGRRPCIIVSALSSGVLAYPYLYFIHQQNTVLAVVFGILMWGLMYQGYNAVFPAYYQELFPSRTRVTGFAISQNIGTAITAFLPSIFAAVAPPGSDVVFIVGTWTFAICIAAAIAALSGRETYRIHMNDLGKPDAVPVPRDEYLRIRAASA